MAAVTLSLWSYNDGELKKFLERYYEKELYLDDDVNKWIYIYNKPLEAVDLISTVIDNKDSYNIGMCIQLDNGDVHPINNENHNDIIKGFFNLFYSEKESYIL
jgi:hypothetical protein